MDFFSIDTTKWKQGYGVDVSPSFIIGPSKDIMIRGRSFYAIWDQEKGLWSQNEFDVARLVDQELNTEAESIKEKGMDVAVKSLRKYKSKSWNEYKNYIMRLPDNYVPLDNKIIFANTEVNKADYASHRLPYPLSKGECPAYEEMISTLYDPEERKKIEWAIGSIFAGDSVNIQKFLVFYGDAGAGKSTILHIIEKLFDGYYAMFEAKELTSNNNAFSTEVFRNNPLVGIQHDGDLSRIEDNTKLNSIVSHEEMVMNEKYKQSYSMRINCFLFMATNKPVKITDAKSGIIRRLIDVKPSGRKLTPKRYDIVNDQIDFELGAIANHCMEVYYSLGKSYYNNYRPFDMILQTDVFYNYVENCYDVFSSQNYTTLKQAYELYTNYCSETHLDFVMPRYKFREELKSYFDRFENTARIGDEGKVTRSCYFDFQKWKFSDIQSLGEITNKPEEAPGWLRFDTDKSILDDILKDCPAQYANKDGIPSKKWESVNTTLKDISTDKLHFVKLDKPQHIFIDFDLKDEKGNKSYERNLEAASKWPATYGELSKSGKGIHLHYYYGGDVSKLSRIYDDEIEIKVLTGNGSLRRQLSKCNNVPIATINSGLPLKGDGGVINKGTLTTEKQIRIQIKRNLNKEIHPNTAPSVSMIKKILDDAYESGVVYDVRDLRPAIDAFANNSTHQALQCQKMVAQMHFCSETENLPVSNGYSDERLSFFDVECFPNLFLIVWKFKGGNKVAMVNPQNHPEDIEDLLRLKLIGFNNRSYDNHMVYAALLGYSNERLFELSQRLIDKEKKGSRANAGFKEALNLSYTDVYDFASAGNKQSLKKYEIQLHIHHQELGLPWDKPVPEELWPKVIEYCGYDVDATEATFDYLSGDWAARQILAKLSGLTVNDPTNAHSKRIIFGENRHPQNEFVYTDLSKEFPGYKFEFGKSSYRGEDPSEGGYVYAVPDIYTNVALLDVESLHPSTMDVLNIFGDRYTDKLRRLKKARVFVKHKDFDSANDILEGALTEFKELLENGTFTFKDLANALKTVINSIYGLTAASFDNEFKDPRNIDNIVAKRGALFMIDLKHAVLEKGFKVAHIKTDSIKIPNATLDIINFCIDFAKKYGYNFKHEGTYERMCLVNDAVYIAKYASKESCMEMYNYIPEDNEEHPGEWTATGAQFQHPYVFKRLFSKEPIEFYDICETKSVKSAMYLDMNEGYPDTSDFDIYYKYRTSIRYKNPDSNPSRKEKDLDILYGHMSIEEIKEEMSKGHNYIFVGKVGQFCPVKDGCGGGILVRDQDGKYNSVTGTNGYRWKESEVIQSLGLEAEIEHGYFNDLCNDAIEKIEKYGNFDQFVNAEKYEQFDVSTLPFPPDPDDPPWYD